MYVAEYEGFTGEFHSCEFLSLIKAMAWAEQYIEQGYTVMITKIQ